MNYKKIIPYFLYLILLFGIWATGNLALSEFKHHHVCPQILQIPACYIILACFIMAFITTVFKFKNILYYIPVGIAFSIAFIASVLEISGKVDCPKTGTGTPMCYYSLALFSSLLIIKYILNRTK